MTKAMTLRLPDEMHEALRREAFERRLPITTIVQEAIEHRRVNNVIGCDVCGKPHVHVSTPGGFRFCDEHYHPAVQPDEWVTAPDSEEFRAGECQGHDACPVETHEHGCFADIGNCDHPEEHRPTDPHTSHTNGSEHV